MKVYLVLAISSICINMFASKGNDTLDCSEVSRINSQLFIQYVNSNNNDSIEYLFKYWQSKCGLCEPLQRAKILYSLKSNNFNEKVLDDSISCKILIYLNRKKGNYLNNEQYYSFIPIGLEFDKFTDSLAKAEIKKYKKKTIEYMLCELYGNLSDSILIKTKSLRYEGSKIHDFPCSEAKSLKKEKNKVGLNIALMSGIWIPTNGLTNLGIHPELGFQSGYKNKNYSAQFTLIIKFLNSANPYMARRVHSNNEWESTKQFVGPYIGLDLGRSILTKNKSEIQLLAGLGFDAFTALDPLKEESRSEDVRSYNVNVGFGYKYYFKKHAYIGIEPKYNIVDYTTTGVTKLKGNFISIRFVYGYIDNGK